MNIAVTKKAIIGILMISGLSGCSENAHRTSKKNDSVAAVAKGADTAVKRKRDDSLDRRLYDVYKYENDSLVQLAYIHYLSPKKILFTIKSSSKKSGKSCELTDTALSTIVGDITDPAAYEDELKDEELYPAYEFAFDRAQDSIHITIGIEPAREKRLAFGGGLGSLCDPSCPLHSAGTLRRIQLSPIKQEGPHLPPIPGEK